MGTLKEVYISEAHLRDKPKKRVGILLKEKSVDWDKLSDEVKNAISLGTDPSLYPLSEEQILDITK